MSMALALRAARRSWWIAALCAVAGVGSASLSASVTAPEWTASATLTVQGPDVQDTLTGVLATEIAARSAAKLVARGDVAGGAGEGGPSQPGPRVNASVPFSTSEVVIQATAGDRAAAIAAAEVAVRRAMSRVTSVAVHIATSPSKQRTATVLPVRLRLLDAPTAPQAPRSPRLWLNAIVGAAIGLALGFGVALLQERLSPSSGSPRARRAAPRGAGPARARGPFRSRHQPRGAHVVSAVVLDPILTTTEGRRAW